ncbi:MAG: transposase [Nostoc sp.]|uniref:IS110 family transposase n=1 Tax=Nostoc sp. TaxID=1180 RepID=UPI002FFB5942
MQILGLDVSKSSVSACLISSKPDNPRQFYYECPFYRFSADAKGIKEMLALKPDIAVMEPTGVNYARLWGTHLARSGIEVRLVGHKELRSYRAYHLALPDKDDDADALALACYGLEYFNDRRRFVQIRDCLTAKIRELVLRLAHLNRVQSPIINRIRQDLAWQFPEVALVRSQRISAKVPLLWGWLAEERKSTRYERLYQNSVGLGISSTVRYHAERICSLQREEDEIEQELIQMLAEPCFLPYLKVFASFNFGDRLTAVLISQIYPFEGYLGEDGKPEIAIATGRKSGKLTKRHLSERRFLKSLGVAPSLNSSGDSHKHRVIGGSDLCRRALWQWVFSCIEPKRRRPKNPIVAQLGNYIDAEKAAGKPVQLVRSRTSAKGAKLLFKELVKMPSE